MCLTRLHVVYMHVHKSQKYYNTMTCIIYHTATVYTCQMLMNVLMELTTVHQMPNAPTQMVASSATVQMDLQAMASSVKV